MRKQRVMKRHHKNIWELKGSLELLLIHRVKLRFLKFGVKRERGLLKGVAHKSSLQKPE